MKGALQNVISIHVSTYTYIPTENYDPIVFPQAYFFILT